MVASRLAKWHATTRVANVRPLPLYTIDSLPAVKPTPRYVPPLVINPRSWCPNLALTEWWLRATHHCSSCLHCDL